MSAKPTKLPDLGYTHYSVKHLDNSVDVVDGMHTHNIERVWRDVHHWVKRPGIKSKYLYYYLTRHLFLASHDEDSRLHHFFIQAGGLYPPQGTQRQQPVITFQEGFKDE